MVVDEDGEAVALLKAQEVRVVAKTRMLAERDGKIQIDFLITMPRELQGNVQSFMITPIMHRKGKNIELEPLQVRGDCSASCRRGTIGGTRSSARNWSTGGRGI